jgi:hypothetical protein
VVREGRRKKGGDKGARRRVEAVGRERIMLGGIRGRKWLEGDRLDSQSAFFLFRRLSSHRLLGLVK